MTLARTALAALFAASLWASALAFAGEPLSTSVMRPTSLDPANAVVSGALPGGQGMKSYYIALDLMPGDLVTQLEVIGPKNTVKRAEFELLDQNARVADSAYVTAESEPRNTSTKTYVIDSGGRHIIRVNVEGKETGTFCILMGGTALPNAAAQGCSSGAREAAAPPPAPSAPRSPPAAPPAPPPNPAVEVIISQCEERLRVGSDLLFDFDRADLRTSARPAIEAIARRIAELQKPALVEGHTDSKGSDSYNQRLSEKRAGTVHTELLAFGAPVALVSAEGRGESVPVVPNEHADGSDDPEGRQKNRRVEVAISTCR